MVRTAMIGGTSVGVTQPNLALFYKSRWYKRHKLVVIARAVWCVKVILSCRSKRRVISMIKRRFWTIKLTMDLPFTYKNRQKVQFMFTVSYSCSKTGMLHLIFSEVRRVVVTWKQETRWLSDILFIARLIRLLLTAYLVFSTLRLLLPRKQNTNLAVHCQLQIYTSRFKITTIYVSTTC